MATPLSLAHSPNLPLLLPRLLLPGSLLLSDFRASLPFWHRFSKGAHFGCYDKLVGLQADCPSAQAQRHQVSSHAPASFALFLPPTSHDLDMVCDGAPVALHRPCLPSFEGSHLAVLYFFCRSGFVFALQASLARAS